MPAGADREALVRHIRQYMQDQASAVQFYRELGAMAPVPKIREYLRHAADDEQRHYELLGQLYRALTGQTYTATPEKVSFASFRDGLLMAIDDELEAYEEYRDEYLRYPTPQIRQVFFELLSDEIEHAVRFNTALHLMNDAS